MALVATTLSAACGASDTVISVTSATNITAPNFTSGAGITYLFIETEFMLVTAVNGTAVSVQRGVQGTPAAAHGVSTPVVSGLPADFGPVAPSVKAQQDASPSGTLYGFSAPVASAATIQAPGSLFHVTGTTTISTILPPVGPGQIEGANVLIVFDGVAPWNAAGNIAVAGTPTTAGSSVSFVQDQGSGKWHPSRLA